MKTRIGVSVVFTLTLTMAFAALANGQQPRPAAPAKPNGPCDIYGAAGDPCVAAHSTTRALYAAYDGPLYQVLRQSDGRTLDIRVVRPGGYAGADAQDAFCAGTYCWITTIYDQSPKHNDLTQAPRGGFSGPAMGGFNNLPLADMAPVTIMGHKVYGVFIEPGMGLRRDDVTGTAVDDQAEGQYWVINGQHFNSGCCFDYGNAEIDSRDDDNGTMETTYYGDSGGWYHGHPPGPWIMTDQENNLVGCVNPDGSKPCPNLPSINWRFVTAIAKGEPRHWTSMGGDAQNGSLSVMSDGPRVNATYDPMRKQGAILLGNGGDNSNRSQGTFYEGAMTAAGTFPTDATDQKVQDNVVAARYDLQPRGVATEKVRKASPVKINELRISSGPPTNTTDSFIELYNSGGQEVDLSNWSLTEHPTQHAIFSTVKIPAGTKLAPRGFYLLGLSNSGLETIARAGETTVYVRSTSGMSAGDTISIGTGSEAETRKIESLGTAATVSTTLWQPLPDGLITIPTGSTNVPVTGASGFTVGQKIALGYGATYPAVARDIEKYEVATVTSVGKQGTQAYLEADAPAGSKNIKVTSVADISVGDKIRLDIDSLGHGIETVTVANVGTQAHRTNLSADADAGATKIKVRSVNGFVTGSKIAVGTPANEEIVTIATVGTSGPAGTGIDIAPALARLHIEAETVVDPGTGLELTAPLKFHHASNLPFADRGTGISFEPATAFAHSSNEPVQALGTGITLDSSLAHEHPIHAVVRDAAVRTAGYQGAPAPNQWFGGPALSTSTVSFGRTTISLSAGAMVLRDAAGLVVDSLNYGLLVDPWAAKGDQAVSGAAENGCRVTAPGLSGGVGPAASPDGASNTSAGRSPDGVDTGSNCMDFVTEPATLLSAASVPGATNLKVASVAGFDAGQTIRVDSGANLETAVIATVGTPAATTVGTATSAGTTVIPVGSVAGFNAGQAIMVGSDATSERAVVAATDRLRMTVTVAAPLTNAHAAGVAVAGTGITLTAALTRPHAHLAQVAGNAATPGAPNHYNKGSHANREPTR
jgi:non-reducing end alpha-L-arabinofuranosidase